MEWLSQLQAVLAAATGPEYSADPFFSTLVEAGAPRVASPVPPSRSRRVGRNEPCPCGSGKKFKKCCGA